MHAEVIWKGGLAFTGRDDHGYSIEMGPSTENDSGASPMDLILIALAGCTAVDVISILQKKRQQVTSFEVHVRAEKAEDHPRVFTAASVEYIVTWHGVRQDAVERAVELSRTKYCPVHAMLQQALPLEFSYRVQAAG